MMSKQLKVRLSMKMQNEEPTTPTPAPAHLSERSRDLWCRLLPRCRSLGRQTMLGEALAALDRCDALRVALTAEGLTVTTERTGMTHINPLLKAEKDARALFCRMWTALGLEWSMSLDGRDRPGDTPEE
jgi:phage terminase small subunit